MLVPLGALTLAAACSSTPSTAPPAGGGKKVDAATAGAVTGRVVFQGTPPPRETLRMGTDPACRQSGGSSPQNDAVLIGPDSALQNAFVYVKDGVDPAYSFDIPTSSALLEQKGCRYVPRVFGIRAGQPLEIVNGDATSHNVHALPLSNREFNRMEQIQGSRMTQTFTVPEVMVRFKCDVHGWMTAFIGVMKDPFFAVTKADGTFEIKGLPPGTYTLEAWHEKFGTRAETVTIGEHQTQSISFSFAAK
jgi:plastocyanin